MNLTVKDKDFLEQLRRLMDEKELNVEMRESPFKHFVLRNNYGDKIHRSFGMTRQGVRWRFQRVFGDVYVSALETILTIERTFGTALRNDAIQIAQERYALRKAAAAHSTGELDERKHKG